MAIEILIITLVLGILICFWFMLYDSRRFVIRTHIVRDKRIKTATRAVVVSDLHNKQFGKNNCCLLEAIRTQKPDMILIAGDILTAAPGKSLEPALSFLRELSEICSVYYGNGNHEQRLKLYPDTYGNMATEYEAGLKDIGISPIVNSHIDLKNAGITIYGCEIDRQFYKRFRRPDMPDDYLDKILGAAHQDKYNIMLAHNPEFFEKYAFWGADLVLSGHVHGGVVRVPIWGKGVVSPSLSLFPKYDGGVFCENKATMILSRGLGAHTIPVRLFNPGEFWVVDFEPGE